jgi:hypothetical protein
MNQLVDRLWLVSGGGKGTGQLKWPLGLSIHHRSLIGGSVGMATGAT